MQAHFPPNHISRPVYNRGNYRGGRGSSRRERSGRHSSDDCWIDGGGRWRGNHQQTGGWGYNQWTGPSPLWYYPPCSYPSWTNMAVPTRGQIFNSGHLGPSFQPGLLGARPRAHLAQSYYPTDIEGAMHTLAITPPAEPYFMDTGATSHMTKDGGTLTSYLNKSLNNSIVVDNGDYIPVKGLGNACLPTKTKSLTLNNVLHAPKLIKNLISVPKFSIDNKMSVEFDLFGFSVKDLHTGIPIMRCNSSADLYPVTSSASMRNLLLELHCPIQKSTSVYCDNVSAIYLSGNPLQHQRTKHIEMDIHFVREKVAKGEVRVLHVPSRHKIADIFTKGLPQILFYDFRSSLYVRPHPPPLSTTRVY